MEAFGTSSNTSTCTLRGPELSEICVAQLITGAERQGQTQVQLEAVLKPIHTRDELIHPRIEQTIWCEFIHKNQFSGS